MKAEIGIENGVPYLHVEPGSCSEASLLQHLRPFMPWTEYHDGLGSVRITGDRLPGMGNLTAQDATSPSVSTEEAIARKSEAR